MSEKLDGQRAFWDGGITRGELAKNVAFSNVLRDKKDFVATGLWSRLGKVIHAPNWWIESLPQGVTLDGELFIDRGKFQELESIVRCHEPDNDRWRNVRYVVFDSPAPSAVFMDGRVNFDHRTKKVFSGLPYKTGGNSLNNGTTYHMLQKACISVGVIQVLEQKFLSSSTADAVRELNTELDRILSLGGEGVMLKNPGSIWFPKRHHNLLKYKPYLDDEATVIGYIPGEGRHEGRMGAIIVAWQDKKFSLGTGFTDLERDNPPSIGQTITFRYRELTNEGIPREGRFLRCRNL